MQIKQYWRLYGRSQTYTVNFTFDKNSSRIYVEIQNTRGRKVARLVLSPGHARDLVDFFNSVLEEVQRDAGSGAC